MLKDLAPRDVQRKKQHANRTKRTFSIESEVEGTRDTNNEKNQTTKVPQIQMVTR